MEIIQFLERSYQHYGYLLVFSGSFLESFIFSGFFLPGGTVVLLAGYFVRIGSLNFPETVFLGTLGMFLGDMANYGLGASNWQALLGKGRVGNYLNEKEEQIKKYFVRHGFSLIFYSHIIGYLRSITCFTAGALRIPPQKYVPVVLLASLVWSVVFVALGVLLGSSAFAVRNLSRRIESLTLGILLLAILIKAMEKAARMVLERGRKQ